MEIWHKIQVLRERDSINPSKSTQPNEIVPWSWTNETCCLMQLACSLWESGTSKRAHHESPRSKKHAISTFNLKYYYISDLNPIYRISLAYPISTSKITFMLCAHKRNRVFIYKAFISVTSVTQITSPKKAKNGMAWLIETGIWTIWIHIY